MTVRTPAAYPPVEGLSYMSNPLPDKLRPTRARLRETTAIVRELATEAPVLFQTLCAIAEDYRVRARMAKAANHRPRKKRAQHK